MDRSLNQTKLLREISSFTLLQSFLLHKITNTYKDLMRQQVCVENVNI